MDPFIKALLAHTNLNEGSGFNFMEFMDEPGSGNKLDVDFINLSITSNFSVELIKNADQFLLKIPSSYNQLKIVFTDDLTVNVHDLSYSIDQEKTKHQITSNPFCISLATSSSLISFDLYSHNKDSVYSSFSFFKIKQTTTESLNKHLDSTAAPSIEVPGILVSGSTSSVDKAPVAFPVPKHALEDINISLFPCTLEDGPEFRRTLAEYDFKLGRVITALSRTKVSLEEFENIATEMSNAQVVLSHSLSDIYKLSLPMSLAHKIPRSAQEKALGTNLQAVFGENYKKAMKDIHYRIRSKPMNSDALLSRRKVFEDESKRYYEWLSKYLSSGKVKEDRLLSKLKLFAVAKVDYLNAMYDSLMSIFLRFVSNSEEGQQLNEEFVNNKKKRIEFKSTIEHCNSLVQFKSHIRKYKELPAGEKSGILFTQGGQGRSGWHKQWVVLHSGKLSEYVDWRKGHSLRNEPIDISLCNIKPWESDKRKNCFRIMTSSRVERYFQAVDVTERDSWVQALFDAGQEIRFHRNSEISETSKRALSMTVLSVNRGDNDKTRRVSSVSSANLKAVQNASKSNLECCDCGSTEGVEWISANLLIVFCIKCSSCHRSLGTGISKVRSLKLDSFNREGRCLLDEINNSASNSFYEALLPAGKKIGELASDDKRLDFIKSKYVAKAWVMKSDSDASQMLIRAIRQHDIRGTVQSIGLGADVNLSITKEIKTNDDDPSKDVTFSIFEYALVHPSTFKIDGKPVFDSAELLLLNGSHCGVDINSSIELSDDALHYWQARIDKRIGNKNKETVAKSSDQSTVNPPRAFSTRLSQHGNGSHRLTRNTAAQMLSRSKESLRSPRVKINNFLRMKSKN